MRIGRVGQGKRVGKKSEGMKEGEKDAVGSSAVRQKQQDERSTWEKSVSNGSGVSGVGIWAQC